LFYASISTLPRSPFQLLLTCSAISYDTNIVQAFHMIVLFQFGSDLSKKPKTLSFMLLNDKPFHETRKSIWQGNSGGVDRTSFSVRCVASPSIMISLLGMPRLGGRSSDDERLLPLLRLRV
jgi:hypothetical protein